MRGSSPQKSGSPSGVRQGAQGASGDSRLGFLGALSLSTLAVLLSSGPPATLHGLNPALEEKNTVWWGRDGGTGRGQLPEGFLGVGGGIGRGNGGGVDPDSRILLGWGRGRGGGAPDPESRYSPLRPGVWPTLWDYARLWPWDRGSCLLPCVLHRFWAVLLGSGGL